MKTAYSFVYKISFT